MYPLFFNSVSNDAEDKIVSNSWVSRGRSAHRSNTAQPSKSSDFAIVFFFSDALELPGVLLLDESPDWWPRLARCLGE
jgi:hypothetical protein